MATIKYVTTPDGVTHNIGGGGTVVTYSISLGAVSSNTVPIVLTGSNGTTDTVYVKGGGDATMSVSGDTMTITATSGQTITYTLSGSGTTTTYTITNTPSSGTASSVTIPAATTSSAGLMTSSYKTKLDGIEAGAEANVQSDWNQANNTADDYIKNKPTLATVATSGNYNDLTNKPTIPSVSVTQKTTTGTNIADITVNGATTQLYAPSGGVTGVKGNAESTYRTGNVNLTAANIGSVDLTDKYTRSNVGGLDWTTQAEGDQKVIAKSALTFWNGSYNGTTSNLSKCSTGNIIGSNGGTMTGQLITSFQSSVAMGSFGIQNTTVPNLLNTVRYSSGCSGSAYISANYTHSGYTITAGWYNFHYMPHRSGGVNGSASGDNCDYGNMLLCGMNNTYGQFIIRFSSGSIAQVYRLSTYSTGTTALINAGTNTGNMVWSPKILHDYIASKDAAATHLIYATPTAKGTTSLSSSKVTHVPLSKEYQLGDSSVLNMLNSGIHVEYTGVYRIDFSTYVTRGSAGMTSGFVRVSSNEGAYSASTEIAASNGYSSNAGVSPSTSASLLTWLQDGSVVYLAARSINAAGTLYNENAMTYLSVQYLGYSND